jgi:hypothetical protein
LEAKRKIMVCNVIAITKEKLGQGKPNFAY